MLASVLLCCKEVSRTHLVQEHLNRWKACKVCCQSKTLLSKLLPSGNRRDLRQIKAALRLLAGRTTLTALLFKLEPTQRQGCRKCRDIYMLCVSVRQNLGSCVLETQRSSKYDGEWPD